MKQMLRPLFLALSLAAASLPALANESAYTKHVWEKCPTIGDEADGVVKRRCAGRAGIDVIWTAGDDSSAVDFGERPAEQFLEIASFFEAGTTIEWRGPANGRPVAAILRYATGDRIGRLNRSVLVVYRLQPDGVSCVMGTVDGRAKDANVRARTLVDTQANGFRCGESKQVAG